MYCSIQSQPCHPCDPPGPYPPLQDRPGLQDDDGGQPSGAQATLPTAFHPANPPTEPTPPIPPALPDGSPLQSCALRILGDDEVQEAVAGMKPKVHAMLHGCGAVHFQAR